jgi:hypothetical protein
MKFRGAFTRIVMVSSMVDFSNATTHPLQRPIQIKNDSGRKTEVYWVGPGGEMVLQSVGVMTSGNMLTLNSYVNHTFIIKEAPDESGTCNAGTKYSSPSLAPCKTTFFTVDDRDDLGKESYFEFHTSIVKQYDNTLPRSSVIHILEDMKVEVKENSNKALETANSITTTCQMKVRPMITTSSGINPNDAIDAFVSCAQPLVANEIEEVNRKIKEQASLRTDLAGEWEDYTCADFNLPTTTPNKMSSWNYRGKEHVVGVLLDRDRAKIHYVKVSWTILIQR